MSSELSPKMSSASAPRPVGVATGCWTIIPARSIASLKVRNLGLKVVHGTVPIRQATVDVGANGDIAAANAELDLAGIETGNTRRDLDLTKPRLLDTGQNPIMRFEATGSVPTADGWQVSGTLTARGTAIPLTLEVALRQGPADDPLSVRATTRFDRRELGIKAPSFMIGHWIEITIDASFEQDR